MEIPVDFAEFGRSAVQAAKQRIIQRVREGERTKIRDEFNDRVGDLLSGEIQQIERGKIVVMLNKFREAEAIIPYREQNHREDYKQGEPIRAVLKKIEETPKGPRLVLSRGDAMFVKALFKLEVPEIQQGIVEIRASSREVGSRTKIAVFSQGRLDRSRRRVRRSQGLAGPGRRAGAWRRAHRHRPLVVGSGAFRQARAGAGEGRTRVFRTPRRRRSRRWWTKTSSRSPSGETGRTCASRRSSRSGRSTCTRAASGWSAAATFRSSRRSPRKRERRRPT